MSEHITRVSLDVALDGDRTQWARVRALTDAQVDAAIEADADSFAMNDSHQITRYRLYRDKSGQWRWSLVTADGKVLAIAPEAFGSRAAAMSAIELIRSVGATADVIAA